MCDKAVDENGDRISEVRQPQVCFGEAPLRLRPGPAPPSRRGDRYPNPRIDKDLPTFYGFQFQNAVLEPGIVLHFLSHFIFIFSIED